MSERLFTHFVENVSWVYHIFHGPSLRNDMRSIYDDIQRNAPVVNVQKLSVVAVILASAAYFWYPDPEVPFSAEDARAASLTWTSLAERALKEAQHDSQPSIETLQASILMSQYLPAAASISKRAYLAGALRSARLLGLHQTDSRRNCRHRMESEHNLVELEVKRRVWWHIVFTDWILAYM